MTSESFCYWLQGFLEVSDAKSVDARQLQVIKDHLNLVFDKKTPNYQVLRDQLQKNPVRQLNPNEILNPNETWCLKSDLIC